MSTSVIISKGAGGALPRWADLSMSQRVDLSSKAKRGVTTFSGFPVNALRTWQTEVCAKPAAEHNEEDRKLISRAPCPSPAGRSAAPVSAQHYGTVDGAVVAALVARTRSAVIIAWVLYTLELLMLLAMIVILALLLWRATKTHQTVMAMAKEKHDYMYGVPVK